MNRTYKKPLAMLLALLILLSVAPTNLIPLVGATDDLKNTTKNAIEWTFDGKNLIISGSGELSREYVWSDEWIDMYDKCVNVIIEEGVTSIGDCAFAQFITLEKVEILGDITRIGVDAFFECIKLKEINLPDSITVIDDFAFEKCSSMENLSIPKNILKIGEAAFKSCSGFTNSNLVLPDTIQKIGFGAFGDTKIKSLTVPFLGTGPNGADYNETYTNHLGYFFGDEQWPDSYPAYDSVSNRTYYLPKTLKTVTVTRQINKNNFENAEKIENVIIKDTVDVTECPDYFAKNCKSLKSIIFENPTQISRIGKYAFFSCETLEDIVIPDNVTEIDTCAFGNCTFGNIQFSQKLRKIGVRAFENCQYLTSVVIPNSVTDIHAFAFSDCYNLGTIIIPEYPLQIDETAFWGTKYLAWKDNDYQEKLVNDFRVTSSGTLIAYLGNEENIVVPDGIKHIGTAFAGMDFIKSITLPDTLEEIERRAFDNCKGITELVVPESVNVINYEAFAGMCNLTKLTVPFVGKTRDVETDTEESLLGYWFSTYDDHDCIYNCYGFLTEIRQWYDESNYFYRSYKPRFFTELTITDAVLRANTLTGYGLTILNIGANVTGIEEYAAHKIELKELHFDENINISYIGDNTFTNNSLTSITIPKSVKRIDNAFSNNQLQEIIFNEGLEIIDGSFAGAKITSIDFPDSLIEIGEESFNYCAKLEYIEFPKNLKTIGHRAFQLNRQLKEVVFSKCITDIGASAFLYCPVKKITAPEGMNAIVDQTFRYCKELEIVIIGSNTEKIGEHAFANCPSLEMVVIPDNVTSISDTAFSDTGENLVIYCNEGSYAQKYAIQNNIKYTTLVLDAIPNQPYTGMAIEPTIGAKANNKSLVLNTDYTLSYSNNIVVGVANVLARGLGDFKNLVATGKFNIVQREIADVQVNFSGDAEYSPNGIEPDITLRLNSKRLRQGEDYEILGLDKIKGTGYYNITLKGMGNFGGTHNLTVEVLPRSIRKTSFATSGDEYLLTDSQYTLVKGVDYKIITRTNDDGAEEKYVVGIGNYNGEILASSPNLPSTKFPGNNALLVIFEFLRSFFSMIFGIFK